MKIILFCLLLFIPSINYSNSDLRILSTTSTRDSGLYSYLLPIFSEKFGINSHVIATGTGYAIKKMQNTVTETYLLPMLKNLRINLLLMDMAR